MGVESVLSGVRILELTHYLAGPFGSMVMADLGAEVIMVERPDVPVNMKRVAPVDKYPRDSYFYLAVNRNKRAIALDLQKPEGRAIFYDLTEKVDVVYDNFLPGVVERLGVDYATLSQINPRIICCSLSGFGSKGPYCRRPAFDGVIQAMSGIMSITGEPDGPPLLAGPGIGDVSGGLFAACGILAALYERERTGKGRKIEVSMLASAIALCVTEAQAYLATGALVPPRGDGSTMKSQPYKVFRTGDGSIQLSASSRFPRLCRALGIEELASDPRFEAIESRWENREALYAIIEPILQTRTTDEWMELLESIPCAPVNNFDKVFADPQVLSEGMLESYEYVLGGQVKTIGNPIKVAGTGSEERKKFSSPPTVGQHTDEVLSSWLGYDGERLADLRARGVI